MTPTKTTLRQSASRLLLAMLSTAGVSGTVVAQEAPLGAELQGVLAYARAQNPELRAMRDDASAARQRVVLQLIAGGQLDCDEPVRAGVQHESGPPRGV